MKILPASGSGWVALLLLPFKVFVPAGYLLLAIAAHHTGYRRHDTGFLPAVVIDGYLLSFFVLALGAAVQYKIAPRRAYLSTCGFIVALFVFGLLILPYLASA
jgi:hypothetical protein